MKDWHGVSYHSVQDAIARDAVAEINDFLFQLSPAIGNIDQGKKTNSSGDSLVPIDDFLFKPGIIGGQLAHGGKAAGDHLIFSSTAHPTKGSIFFGKARQTAYDETEERIGINVPVPLARLHIKVALGGIPT